MVLLINVINHRKEMMEEAIISGKSVRLNSFNNFTTSHHSVAMIGIGNLLL